jgi:hypothetical protein
LRRWPRSVNAPKMENRFIVDALLCRTEAPKVATTDLGNFRHKNGHEQQPGSLRPVLLNRTFWRRKKVLKQKQFFGNTLNL